MGTTLFHALKKPAEADSGGAVKGEEAGVVVQQLLLGHHDAGAELVSPFNVGQPADRLAQQFRFGLLEQAGEAAGLDRDVEAAADL